MQLKGLNLRCNQNREWGGQESNLQSLSTQDSLSQILFPQRFNQLSYHPRRAVIGVAQTPCLFYKSQFSSLQVQPLLGWFFVLPQDTTRTYRTEIPCHFYVVPP